MDNLKKNIHFVVFGAGVLVGIILLVVGIVIRGGTESGIEDAKAKLATLKSVPTKGDLDVAEKRSKRFGASLEAAGKYLNGAPGTAFATNYKSWNNGRQFYSDEALGKISQLKTRFADLEKPLVLPAIFQGWKFERPGSSTQDSFWISLEKEMLDPSGDKIREQQMRLRFLEELATTLEKLVETGADDGMGVKIIEVKFDAFNPGSEADAPWQVLPMQLKLECSPGFAALLSEELVNPSQRTLAATEPPKEGAPARQRLGFPIFLDLMQFEMLERPGEQNYIIANDEKGSVLKVVNDALRAANETELPVPPKPEDLDLNQADGRKFLEAASDYFNKKDRLVLPVRAGLKLRAATFNTKWRAVKDEE